MPFIKARQWLMKEKELGSPNPDNVILATANKQGAVHSRVVAVREFNEEGVLFFTQKGTRKYEDLMANPQASMTLWLAQQQREIILDGFVKPLSEEENQRYWKTMPRDRQLRFSTYAPSSGQAIGSILELEVKSQVIAKRHMDEPFPMSEFYCGFRLIPEIFYFYALGITTFSEVSSYSYQQGLWKKTRLSP